MRTFARLVRRNRGKLVLAAVAGVVSGVARAVAEWVLARGDLLS